MKNILIFGAGKSATVLLEYLIKAAKEQNWHLIIIDKDVEIAKKKTGDTKQATVESFDIKDEEKRRSFISKSDLVISMLPAALHFLIVKDCIHYKKHLLTPSYILPEVEAMRSDIEKAGILMVGEMGLDPGIDHMSAMKTIHQIRDEGGEITAFESFCGALVAPESDDNPWHYKISWSPNALITAGKDGAEYRENGVVQKQSYESLFSDCKTVEIPEMGQMAWYPNRNSERYAKLYRLYEVPTVLRATLRHPAFCEGWQYMVKLGLTDTEKELEAKGRSYKDWMTELVQASDLNSETQDSILSDPHSKIHKQFQFLGLLDDQPLPKKSATAGDILFELLEKKLSLKPDDKDMIVMLHRITHKKDGRSLTMKSLLVVKGENNRQTAIAKTVGLPLGILARLILNGKIQLTGLHLPILPEIYLPILEALEEEDICFREYML